MFRKPPRCSSKILRWKWKYLLLRADQRLRHNHRDVLLPAHPQTTIPIWERTCTDIEPEDDSSVAYPVSKQLSTLLRHGDLPREEDGAIEFWRLKEYLQNDFMQFKLVWWKMGEYNDQMWRKQENISRLYWSIRTRNSLSPSSSRSFRSQSHWSHTVGQCVDSELCLRVHLSHWMCNQFALHHEFPIDTGRTQFEQKTDGIFHVCGSYEKEHKDTDVINFDAPRLAWYKQKVLKKHQNTMYWVDNKLALKKGLTFYQTRLNVIIPWQLRFVVSVIFESAILDNLHNDSLVLLTNIIVDEKYSYHADELLRIVRTNSSDFFRCHVSFEISHCDFFFHFSSENFATRHDDPESRTCFIE